MAGTLNTSFVKEIIFKLPELNQSAEIYVKYYLSYKLLNYNLILGRNILHKLGIILTTKIKQLLGKWFQFQ